MTTTCAYVSTSAFLGATAGVVVVLVILGALVVSAFRSKE